MPVLCYHSIQDQWESPLAVRPADFRRQCAWLRNRAVVDLAAAVRLMNRTGRLPRRTVALTFDDGFADNYETVLPVLRRLRLPATVFVVAATLDGTQGVDWIDDPPPFPLRTLSADQVREMAEAGITIGSHSLHHRVLTELSPVQCLQDLRESREVIEEVVGGPVEYLAYPRGAHDQEVRAAAAAAGYRYSFSLPERREKVSRHSLPRVGIFRANSFTRFRVKNSEWYLPVRTSPAYGRLAAASRRAGTQDQRFPPGAAAS